MGGKPKSSPPRLRVHGNVLAICRRSLAMEIYLRKPGRTQLQRALALLACATLLYFACGGVLLHEHTTGPDGACHVCQALHMPALASARLAFSITPTPIIWLTATPQYHAPNDSFSLHRPSRAPPIA